jgi:DNA-binding CsgD family transcriptional regulator
VVPRELRATVQRPALSHRERQVLTYVTEGLSNAQIAEELFLSESTVKSHLSSAFAKFGVSSRREAAALFLELNGSQK